MGISASYDQTLCDPHFLVVTAYKLSRLERQPHVFLNLLAGLLSDFDRVALGTASHTLFAEMARQHVSRPIPVEFIGPWSIGKFHPIISSARDLIIYGKRASPVHVTLGKHCKEPVESFRFPSTVTHVYLETGNTLLVHELLIPSTVKHFDFGKRLDWSVQKMPLPASLNSIAFCGSYTIWIRDTISDTRMWLIVEGNWTVGGVLYYTLDVWMQWKNRNCILYLADKLLPFSSGGILRHGIVAGTQLDLVELSDVEAQRIRKCVFPHIRKQLKSSQDKQACEPDNQERMHMGPTLAYMKTTREPPWPWE